MSTFRNNPHIIDSDDIEALLASSAVPQADGSILVSLVVRIRAGAKVVIDEQPLGLALDGVLPRVLTVPPAVDDPTPANSDVDAPDASSDAAPDAPQGAEQDEPPAVVPVKKPKQLSISDEGASHEN